MGLLQDITSRDPERVWLSSCAIRTLRDADEIAVLVHNLDEIKQKTKRLNLGGSLRPNASHLDFAIRKLEFLKSSSDCPCALYLMDDLYDPAKEEKEGNIQITGTIMADWGVDHYECICKLCGVRFRVDERQYHYTWWAWQKLECT